MSRHNSMFSGHGKLVALLGCAVALFCFVPVVNASSFHGGPRHVIPAAAFLPDEASAPGFFSFAGGYYQPMGGSVCLRAPLYISDGLFITRFRVMAFNNMPLSSSPFIISLRRKALDSTATSQVLAQVTVPPNVTDLATPDTETIEFSQVSNTTHAYSVTTCMSATNNSQRLYAVEVWAFPEEIFRDRFED